MVVSFSLELIAVFRKEPLNPETKTIDFRSMSHLVLLNDRLVSEAEVFGAIADRSPASQIEFWVRLGQVIELRVLGNRINSLLQVESTQQLVEIFESHGISEDSLSILPTPENSELPRKAIDSKSPPVTPDP